MSKTKSGFTIVELLIVIVVIGILAAITIVAYNGVQVRALNATRASDIASIQKALEMYRIQNNRYPVAQGPGTNVPSGFSSSYGTFSYTYSIATDDSWLKELKNSDLLSAVPKDPINNNDKYYVYISYNNGIGACTQPFYILIARGWDGGTSTMPASSHTVNCNAAPTYASWTKDNTQAVFSNL